MLLKSPSRGGESTASPAKRSARRTGGHTLPLPCRLLILDDDPVSALTLQLMAESRGVAARVHTEPVAFLAELELWQPTHVSIDLHMPGQDGMQVLGELARRRCSARVLISSGVGVRVLEAAARSAVEHGLSVAGVLPKPVVPALLLRLLGPAFEADGDGNRDAATASAAPVAGAEADTVATTQAAPEAAPKAATQATPKPAGARTPAFIPSLPALQEALAQHQLHVAYQPKLRCDTGQLCGVEALVRWLHPEHGPIGPDRFVPLAESSGHIDQLTLQVLDQALAWFVPWCQADAARLALTLSINLSARSLSSPYLVAALHDRCCDSGLDPARLIFELTETAAMDDPALALELLTRMRVQGFQLSIDDFGTGFSSMVQLVRLPFTEIKVDRSFVMTACQSAESRAVIRCIVELGHNLGLRVTAEGVEDAGALAYLRTLGCDEAQGYFIAPPLLPDQLAAWAQLREVTRSARS